MWKQWLKRRHAHKDENGLGGEHINYLLVISGAQTFF
jgi:hypothetical protein